LASLDFKFCGMSKSIEIKRKVGRHSAPCQTAPVELNRYEGTAAVLFACCNAAPS
jgi:hypothetical protein